MRDATDPGRRAKAARAKVGAARGAALSVALIADTHGYIDPRVLARLRDADLVVHAGDIGGADVLAALPEVHAVRGNNDVPAKWPASERAALAGLPEELRLELPGGVLVVVHGDRVLPALQRHEKLRRLYPEARSVVYGHTHRLVCDRSREPWVLNPGAAGRTRTFGGPSCLILRAGARSWSVRALRFPP
ncbi:MAG TPA: metallophosphoesterase family protein [Burkholderiales bacterium]